MEMSQSTVAWNDVFTTEVETEGEKRRVEGVNR